MAPSRPTLLFVEDSNDMLSCFKKGRKFDCRFMLCGTDEIKQMACEVAGFYNVSYFDRKVCMNVARKKNVNGVRWW